MNRKLNFDIAPANFELVRDQIAALLKIELDGQDSLGDELINNSEYVFDVYVERYTPIDRSENIVINVGIIRMTFDNQTPVTQRNGAEYYIDVYSQGTEKEGLDGCLHSAIKLQRTIGVIRSIIQSPYYDRLGFTNGIIERRSVNEVIFASLKDEKDTINSRMARITLKVDIHEETRGIEDFIAGTSWQTVVKLELTEKGYKFINVN